MSNKTRLNKLLAERFGISRREADNKIAHGDVTVNNTPAILGAQIDPAADIVLVNGRKMSAKAMDYTYLLVNKPIGYVCSRRQQGSARTIYSLLPSIYQQLKTVGRLDKDSSGLIVLTNDGNFAHHMTHPSFAKTKVYEVQLDTPLQPLHHQMISDHGISLTDGPSKFSIVRINEGDHPIYQITMREGRNRQIRRTFATLGYTVTKLHRTQFGNYHLASLASGAHQLATHK